eukprot:SAG31_NODE_146_length_22601_cov_56.529192_7_plen_230_part_00
MQFVTLQAPLEAMRALLVLHAATAAYCWAVADAAVSTAEKLSDTPPTGQRAPAEAKVPEEADDGLPPDVDSAAPSTPRSEELTPKRPGFTVGSKVTVIEPGHAFRGRSGLVRSSQGRQWVVAIEVIDKTQTQPTVLTLQASEIARFGTPESAAAINYFRKSVSEASSRASPASVPPSSQTNPPKPRAKYPPSVRLVIVGESDGSDNDFHAENFQGRICKVLQVIPKPGE